MNIYKKRSVFYHKLHLFIKAIELIKKLLGIHPDHTKLILQAKAYIRLGMIKEAIEAYRKAIRLEPANSETYYRLGNAYSRMDNFKEAVKAYKQAVSKRSKFADALYKLGYAYHRLGMHKEAIDTTNRLLKAAPKMSAAYKNLSHFYGISGMNKEAAETLRKAVQLDPANPELRYKLALRCLESHDKESALEEYRVLKNLSSEMADKLYERINSNNISYNDHDSGAAEITHVYFKG